MLIKAAVLRYVPGEQPQSGQPASHTCPPPPPTTGNSPPSDSGLPPGYPPGCRYVCQPRLPGGDGQQSGACEPMLECP